MSTSFWVVGSTKPQREKWAAENVKRQGYNWYLPTLAPRHSSGSPTYMFPRYIFIQIEDRWRSLLGTFGITSLIMSGQRPAIVPEIEIKNLRSRENAQGLIQLPERRFEVGDHVNITTGLMAGQRGIFAGDGPADRVKVLMEYLGRKTPFLISEGCLEAAE